MAEEVTKLKRKRTVIKSITTKLLNKINDLLNDDNLDVMDLEESREHLVEKESQIKKLDVCIETMIQDLDELDKEVETSNEYRDRMTSAKFKINNRLKKTGKPVQKPLENIISEIEDLPHESELRNNVRLPKLTIEKFNGNPEIWLEFWSQFKSAIHENKTLSKIDKFDYLKSFLSGSASTALQGLLITEDNYDISIEILQQRYGRKDIVVSSHVNNLLNLNPVKNVSNIKELRDLYDYCEIQIRNLESLGVELNSYGNLLFPMLVKLIPSSLILEFNRNKSEEESWDVRQLLNFLKAEIENRERTFAFNKKYEDEKTSHSNYKSSANRHANLNSKEPNVKHITTEKNKRFPSAYAFNTNIKSECIFCNESSDHTSDTCVKPIEEKKDAIKSQGRCFNCLKKNHMSRSCYSKIRCTHCNGKHSQLICHRMVENKTETDLTEAAVTSISHLKTDNQIFLQTFTATAVGDGRDRGVRILCDGRSQRTFVLENVSKQLNLKAIGEENITIYTFGTNKPVTEKRKRVQLILRDPRRFKNYIVVEALETPSISGALINTPGKEIRNYCKKQNMRSADEIRNSNNLMLSVLIGSDYYWKIVTGKVHRICGSLVAVETIFGWTINGTSSSYDTFAAQSVIQVMKNATNTADIDNDINDQLKKFWDLETLGIEPEKLNMKEDYVLEEFNQNIQLKGNRYEVKLPWNDKVEDEELSENYEVAISRLNTLAKRFTRNLQLYERYRNIREDYLEQGIAEEVSGVPNSKLYYMPHQPVIREDKTTSKLRIVFDASSHIDGVVSLNQCLNSGPNLNPDLLDILLQFRQHRVPFIADIKQAFLQILLSEDDRDAVRFLWINSPTEKLDASNLQVLCMTLVIFGVASSPFILSGTIKHHINKYRPDYPTEFELLNNCLYVDDLVSGVDEENEVLQIYKKEVWYLYKKIRYLV